MKKKYKEGEKYKIALEAISSKDISVIALKYDIHLGTLYNWIIPLKTQITLEAISNNNIKEVALKYDMGLNVLYKWIKRFDKTEKRSVNLKIRLTNSEKEKILKRCKALGYENDMSGYIRRLLFSKDILIGNPQEVREELYRSRGEINKIGNNINHIANYTNYLWKNKYVENSFSDELIKQTSALSKVCREQRTVIDNALRRIFN